MGKPVSTDQSHAVMASLATNADWDEIKNEDVQSLIRNPKKVGIFFTEFLKTARYYTEYLRPISKQGYMKKTSGDRRILEHPELFKDGINPWFRQFPFEHKTEETFVRWYLPSVLVKSGTGKEVFASLDFRKVSFTQEQILLVAEVYRKWVMVSAGTYLFPLMLGGEEYVVAIILSIAGTMSITASKRDSGMVYQPGDRVLILVD